MFSESSRRGYFVDFYNPQYLQTLFLKQFQQVNKLILSITSLFFSNAVALNSTFFFQTLLAV